MRVRGAWIQAEEGWTKRRKRDTTASSLTDHHLHSVEPDDDPPFGDWSVFQQIFAEHWDVFAHAHPRSQPSSYEGRVAKMLVCGNSEQMGCTAVLCLRCAKVHVDNWVSQVSQGLHAGGIYRHIIVPVPACSARPLTRTRRLY